MLNKLLAFVRQNDMITPGERIICALSGGADSVALVWAMYLLQDKLQIHLEAVHFNHGLRGDESDADESFVRAFCRRYEIPLHVGRGTVIAGKKGLEAAAREARYDFFRTLNGKIATAHTADDNGETVLMHMVRGTGLKGLGGITPKADGLIRPMLTVTRQEVLNFLEEYHLSYVQDSTNDSDDFLRNRLRHHVLPILQKENPCLSLSLSQMALRLRKDEENLAQLAREKKTLKVEALRNMPDAIRSRVLAEILEDFGVKEPSAQQIKRLEDVVYSPKPSAKAEFPNGVEIGRCYGTFQLLHRTEDFCQALPCPGRVALIAKGLQVTCRPIQAGENIGFVPSGSLVVRSRKEGDRIRLSGGTKSLKKLFIDKKIPASVRNQILVISDDLGVIWVQNIGMNLDRMTPTGFTIQLDRI